jgi:hypothetical protein
MRKLILLSLVFCSFFMGCQDDEDSVLKEYAGSASKRVKRIVGQNALWGEYCLNFCYNEDGTLKEAWRMDSETGDTLGTISVKYDPNYYLLSIIDYVSSLDPARLPELQKNYPDTWKDTVRNARSEQVLCSVELKDGLLTKILKRPRRYVGGGSNYDVSYVDVSTTVQIPEGNNGKITVVRCLEYVNGAGGNSDETERTVSKYEFTYAGDDLVGGTQYFPDSYRETDWKKGMELGFTVYSGILTGVECDVFRMRRGGNQVVVAEPGKTYTYTLDEEGLALRMETSDGEEAMFEYEAGSGNFYGLFAMPLDRVLGKVWVR